MTQQPKALTDPTLKERYHEVCIAHDWQLGICGLG